MMTIGTSLVLSALINHLLFYQQEGIHPAKYLARAKWVQITNEAGWDEETCQAYIRQAYDIICGKLTKKARAEIGV